MKKANKFKKVAVIALLPLLFMTGLVLPISSAEASIKSDLLNNLSFEQVIKNGLSIGLPMSVTLVKIFSSTTEEQHVSIVSAAISVSPSDVSLIVRTAIRAGADAEEVVSEAVALVPSEKKLIMQTAIRSGADVMDVTLASAAGLARSGAAHSSGGALGAFVSAPTAFEGGFVAPITLPSTNTNGGGARPPVAPPSIDDSVSPS